MIISLAVRNVLRNFRRLAPMMMSLILIFTVLIIGNAVLTSTRDSLYEVYAHNLSGDLTVSKAAEGNFTLFGSDQLLVGNYIVPPTLINFEYLRDTVGSFPEVRASGGLISSAAKVEIGPQSHNFTVLGVDFQNYPQIAAGLQLEAGSFPEQQATGMLLQEQAWGGERDLVGTQALLASGFGYSFTLREVPVTGTFRFPVQDSMLDRLVLVDADTARALNGYFYGNDVAPVLSEENRGALESEFDDMFSGGESNDAGAEAGSDAGINPENLFEKRQDTQQNDIEAAVVASDGGAWNFLLVSLHDRNDTDKVMRKIKAAGYTEANGYLVRDWSDSVGGNAQLAWFLQLIFNIGLWFVSCGAVIVAANALLLSVLERIGEIGTLRAIGASRLRISGLISLETGLVVLGSAVIGILAGLLLTEWLNNVRLVVNNPYISMLFKGEPIRGEVSVSSIVRHLLVALGLTLLSLLYPLKKALGIHPVKAMAE